MLFALAPDPVPLVRGDDIDDATLVGRARGGDRWAMEALYRRHVRRVTNAVTRMVGRTGDADDAVQEAFLVAFSRLDDLRDPGAFRGWLAQIAVNEVRMRLRKRKRLRSFAQKDDEDDATLERLASEDASPEVRAELAKLDRVLASMDVELRMAWTLRYVEGWELTEVATALDCSLATAKRRIGDAKRAVDVHVGGGR
ncbi:MAG: RNA polymerase sigma factor [Sandaracinaceae bacterium]